VPDRERAGLPDASRQSLGDAALPALSSCGCRSHDPLDNELRPTWLFGNTVHEGCDRAGYYEQGDFASTYDSPKCIVKLGCWGPVVKCNVPKRGWINGIGGCPNVGGICIGCTMPGFPDKFMPFMDEPPGAKLSSAAVGVYGKAITALRKITATTMDDEPGWRTPGSRLTTGYKPTGDHHGQERHRRDELGSDHTDRRQPRDLHRRSTSASARWWSATARRRSSAATRSS
jgi:hypothetical protein